VVADNGPFPGFSHDSANDFLKTVLLPALQKPDQLVPGYRRPQAPAEGLRGVFEVAVFLGRVPFPRCVSLN
jgi:hypothetical protein